MSEPSIPIGHGTLSRWLVTLAMLACGAGALAWGERLFDDRGPAEVRVGVDFQRDHHVTAVICGAALIVFAAVFFIVHRRSYRATVESMIAYGQAVDALSPLRRSVDLAVASVLGLFLEVALIRWHGTEFRACAYFKNITLLACFLGLGLGFARARRPIVSMPIMLFLLAVQLIGMDALGLVDADRAIRTPVAWEVHWGLGQTTHPIHYVTFYGFFAALFISSMLIFIPVGQLTGRLMDPVRPIASYTVNICGSIIGVLLFAAVSFLWLPPSIWFGLATAMALWLLRHAPRATVLSGVSAAVLLAWLGHDPRPEIRDIYSPYQRLEVAPDSRVLDSGRQLALGTAVAANKAYYLHAFNLADDFVARWRAAVPAIGDKADAYNAPYQLGAAPQRVLVVGAGAGNDVAAAVRHNVAHVDAVEIDPAIRWVGRTYHPESPYQAAGVRSIINDARAFMKQSPPQQYDLIVFGLLDSHTLLSGMGAIRLDNFVYTLQSMQEARRLLRPGGRLCLSFALGPRGPFSARMYAMLTAAFGHPPRTFLLQGNDTLFAIGDQPADVPGSPPGCPDTTADVAASAAQYDLPPSTDDWPFPFLLGRTWNHFPKPYVYLIALLAGISLLWVLGTAERGSTFDGHFFFLGGAFLLIETKGITELALVFGTTWIVTSVVIVSILTLILLANWLVTLVRPTRVHWAYLGLFASLAAGYFVPVERLLDAGRNTAIFAAPTLLCLPLFFAGVIFATSLKQARALPSAFASNLLGAILGGLFEYSSIVLGFRKLYLVGMALYGLSWLCLTLRRAPSAAPAGARP